MIFQLLFHNDHISVEFNEVGEFSSIQFYLYSANSQQMSWGTSQKAIQFNHTYIPTDPCYQTEQ